MCLAGVSTRQVDDTGQLPWGDRMPSRTLSGKLRRVYAEIDQWRTRPLEGEYPYVFVGGVWHKRSWGGSVENVSILVAIGVSKDGHREAVGVAEGMREDSASWEQFFRGMIERGLKGVRLVVGDRCTGLVATVDSMLPKAGYQRRMARFLRNVLSKVPPSHREWASAALKAVFTMESRESTLDKAETVTSDMEARRLKAAADCLREDIQETTTYLLDEVSCGTPQAHPHEQHVLWAGFSRLAVLLGFGVVSPGSRRRAAGCWGRSPVGADIVVARWLQLALWSAVMRAGRFGGLPFRGSPA